MKWKSLWKTCPTQLLLPTTYRQTYKFVVYIKHNFEQNFILFSGIQDRRQQITKLSNVHELLKNLQFLFDLPKKLEVCVEEKNFSLVSPSIFIFLYFNEKLVIFFANSIEKAVKYYAKSEQVLKEFGDHPSFSGIQSDCRGIVVTLKKHLKEQFHKAEVIFKQVNHS